LSFPESSACLERAQGVVFCRFFPFFEKRHILKLKI